MKDSETTTVPVYTTNEDVLCERLGFVIKKIENAEEYAEFLKRCFGEWKNIPNKLRTIHAKIMRSAGCRYDPKTGWTEPNSHELSDF